MRGLGVKNRGKFADVLCGRPLRDHPYIMSAYFGTFSINVETVHKRRHQFFLPFPPHFTTFLKLWILKFWPLPHKKWGRSTLWIAPLTKNQATLIGLWPIFIFSLWPMLCISTVVCVYFLLRKYQISICFNYFIATH